MIIILDYGLGNIGSILNMLNRIGALAKISSDLHEVEKADKLILPGVGAFDYGMQQLRENGFVELLQQKVLSQKIPILGICLGAQLFTNESEEGECKGLGWLDARVKKFQFSEKNSSLKVPHMGWSQVVLSKKSKLFHEMYENPRFYFVHSFYMEATVENDVFLKSCYGNEFVCGFEKENILGVQFHPEKSHKYGMKLLKNFAELY